MKWLRFTILILIAAVLQASTVMNLFSLTQMEIKPDILLILMIYFAITADSYDAVITSFAIGFAADIASTVMGPHIISFGLIGTAVAHVRKIILLKKTGQQAITIFIAAFLIGLIVLALTGFKVSAQGDSRVFEVFAVAVYSAIVWFLIKWPIVAIGKWLGIGVFRFGLKAKS